MAATSAAELEPVSRVTARLQAVLEKARSVKPEASVEPPLPAADVVGDVSALHDDFEEKYDQVYRYLSVETASRELFYSLITSTDINDPAFVEVWNFLDIVQLCGDYGKCAPELVCWLLEELLDSQTTDGCRIVFDYLDSRRERLAQKDFHKKNLIFLRSCNELLRRLSRAEDAIFCGRVFFFLFQTFPLGDKSSVNLRGEFHTENQTKFDVQEPNAEADDGEKMDVDSKPDETPAKDEGTPQPTASGKPGSKAVPIKPPPKKTQEEEVLSSSQLYPTFWRLQHDFSDPTRLFDVSNFTTFKKGLASTIAKFKKTPTVVQTRAVEEDKRGTKRKHGENGINGTDNDHLADNYNPKYLTSRDLFDLELSDLAFQRHILVQALILIDFLLSLTEKAKKRLADLSTTNKSMLYAFTLSEEDTKWALTTRSTITSYLSLTNEGRQYCRMVETVLARDKNWVRWKVESCPSIVRGPVSTEQELEARKGARDATRPRRIPDKPMGAMDLSFLDEGSGGGGLDALKDPARYTAPTIEKLVEQVVTDKLDLEMAMDDGEKASLENAIQNAKWRALRQARAENLSLLDKVDSTKDLEDMLKEPELEPQVESEGHQEGASSQQNGGGEGDESGAAVAVTVADDTTTPANESLHLPETVEDKVSEDAAAETK
ncbi:hypothetical protein M409DRAFT_22053 [Zasmidium cellare ATCC 36951]|uniref:Nuclear matrix protein n=1 Tax=Zasmidium cellare ATCC 36951 TaxID=1080233 RepID=A0A6A6CQZ7_ZASCE|nr:uncharacterized protein M409DRAFT_22053 [Zasmidium cellare ATCC 36951]KAF2167906.1 hypothetical protein M409DRAFT_22053 [Zasmidium cellare ATCC 36951]